MQLEVPQLLKDVSILEEIQGRAAKMLEKAEGIDLWGKEDEKKLG